MTSESSRLYIPKPLYVSRLMTKGANQYSLNCDQLRVKWRQSNSLGGKFRIHSARIRTKIAETWNVKRSSLERKLLYWDEASSFFSDKYLDSIRKYIRSTDYWYLYSTTRIDTFLSTWHDNSHFKRICYWKSIQIFKNY